MLGLTSESRLQAIGGDGGPESKSFCQALDNAFAVKYNIDENMALPFSQVNPFMIAGCESGTE